MSAPLLQIEGLSVRVEDKEILHGIDLQIKKGETHVLMGQTELEVYTWLCTYGKS